MASFFDRLRTAARARGSQLCVGLDPEPAKVDGGLKGAVERAIEVIAATSDVACCYKPNAAFWEQYGPDGWSGLADARAAIPADVPVLFDAKRADVGPTMAAYVRAAFEALRMDAMTVHSYHGSDSLAEAVRFADRGVYVVCHTSNPGRTDLQHLPSPDDPLYVRVAELAHRVNEHGNVGLVVGATAPAEAAILRQRFPELPFLMPGLGRQGGDVEGALRAAWNGDEVSALMAVSSAIFDSDDPGAEAKRWRDAINTAIELAGVR